MPRSSVVEQSLDKRLARGSNPRGATNRQQKRGLHTSSAEWRQIRAQVLTRDCYTCRACGGYGNHVDHINNDSHDNSESNLQTLCQPCHSAKTAAEQTGGKPRQRVATSEDGSPIGGW